MTAVLTSVINDELLEATVIGDLIKGDKGDTGATGPQGPKGDTGATGPKGEDGTMSFEDLTPQQKASLKGDKGDTGAKGDKGDTGSQGPQGETGPIGPTGPKGDTGEKGDTGSQGPKGDKGDKGDTGETGPAGQSFPTISTYDDLKEAEAGVYYIDTAIGIIVPTVMQKIDNNALYDITQALYRLGDTEEEIENYDYSALFYQDLFNEDGDGFNEDFTSLLDGYLETALDNAEDGSY